MQNSSGLCHHSHRARKRLLRDCLSWLRQVKQKLATCSQDDPTRDYQELRDSEEGDINFDEIKESQHREVL